MSLHLTKGITVETNETARLRQELIEAKALAESRLDLLLEARGQRDQATARLGTNDAAFGEIRRKLGLGTALPIVQALDEALTARPWLNETAWRTNRERHERVRTEHAQLEGQIRDVRSIVGAQPCEPTSQAVARKLKESAGTGAGAEFYNVEATPEGGFARSGYTLQRGHVAGVQYEARDTSGPYDVAIKLVKGNTITCNMTVAQFDAFMGWYKPQLDVALPQFAAIREALGAKGELGKRGRESTLDAAKRVAAERDRHYKANEEARHELTRISDLVKATVGPMCGAPALGAVEYMARVYKDCGDAAQAMSKQRAKDLRDVVAIRDKVGARFGERTVDAIDRMFSTETDPAAFAEAAYNEAELKIASLEGRRPLLWGKLRDHERNALVATARKMLEQYVPQARLKPRLRTYDPVDIKITFNGHELKGCGEASFFDKVERVTQRELSRRHDDMVDALTHALGGVGASYVFANPPYTWATPSWVQELRAFPTSENHSDRVDTIGRRPWFIIGMDPGKVERQAERQRAKVMFFPFGPDGRRPEPKVTLTTLPYTLKLKRYEAIDMAGKEGVAGGAIVRWFRSPTAAERAAVRLNRGDSLGPCEGSHARRDYSTSAVIDWLPGAKTQAVTPAPADETSTERFRVLDYSPAAAGRDVEIKQQVAAGKVPVVVWYARRTLAFRARRSLRDGWLKPESLRHLSERRPGDEFAVVDTQPSAPAVKKPALAPAPVVTPPAVERYCVVDYSPAGANVDVTLKQRIAAGDAKVVVWYGAGERYLANAAEHRLKRGANPTKYDQRRFPGDVFAVVDTQPGTEVKPTSKVDNAVADFGFLCGLALEALLPKLEVPRIDPAIIKQWERVLGIDARRGQTPAPPAVPAPAPAQVAPRFSILDISPGASRDTDLMRGFTAGKFKAVAWFASRAVAEHALGKLSAKHTRPDDYDSGRQLGECFGVIDTQPNA